MKKITLLFSIIFVIYSCSTPKIADSNHNSSNSLDWEGSYRGFIPSKDGDLKTTLTLLKNNKFKLSTVIENKNLTEKEIEGTFSWDKTANIITLNHKDVKTKYKIMEGKVLQLDEAGNKITGNKANEYILSSLNSNSLFDKRWKLIELNGVEISEVLNSDLKPIYMKLSTEENKIYGFSGCNNFGGTYTLTDSYRIKFSQMFSTQMACIYDMSQEKEFLDTIQKTDSYLIKDGILILVRARMAPLARFKMM